MALAVTLLAAFWASIKALTAFVYTVKGVPLAAFVAMLSACSSLSALGTAIGTPSELLGSSASSSLSFWDEYSELDSLSSKMFSVIASISPTFLASPASSARSPSRPNALRGSYFLGDFYGDEVD